MSHFRNRFMLFGGQIRVFTLLAGLGLLSACTAMKTEGVDPKKTDNVEEANKKGEQKTGQASEAINSLLAFQGKDPMADIQINAEIKKTYSQVANLATSRKYSEALIALDGVKVKYPQLSGPDYQRARIFLSQQKLDDALTAVELSLKNNKRNYYSLNLKGIILREKGLFDESKQTYLTAIEIYPPYPNSHLNLGVLADIYMRDSGLALIQYQQYQALTGNADKKIKNWIIEIERRMRAGGQ